MKLSNQKIGIITLLPILFGLVGLGIFISYSLKTNEVEEVIKQDPVIKVLCVIGDNEGNALTTNLIMHYPKTQATEIFNIPGNTGAIFQSIGRTDRIDAVYRDRGIESYVSEIQKLLGITIPFTLEISSDELEELTDLLGGLNLFVPSPVECKNPDDGELWLLPSGIVKLDGEKIQTYMLYLQEDEELDASLSRRQNVFMALLSAINEKQNIILEKKNFSVFEKTMETNVDSEGLNTLLYYLSNIDTEPIVPKTITGLLRIVDGKELLFPLYNGEFIKDVVRTSLNSLVMDASSAQNKYYTLEVQNGTTVQGLARNTSVILQGAGYDVLSAVNAPSNDYEHTMIIDHTGDESAVQTLADFIHCAYIVSDAGGPLSSGVENNAELDFTLVLGRDFDGRYVVGGYVPPIEEDALDEVEETE